MICIRRINALETSTSFFGRFSQEMNQNPVPSSLDSLLNSRLSFFSISETSQTDYISRETSDSFKNSCTNFTMPVCWPHWSCGSLCRLEAKSLRAPDETRHHVSTCDLWHKNKTYNQIAEAPIQLLRIPQYPWEVISMDFITCLEKALDSTPS